MYTASNTLSSGNSMAYQAVNNGQVTSAIKVASAQSGVDFSYMLNNAATESGMNPKAQASSSSASGLFQFVEQTWFRMIKSYGEKYGLNDVADRISIGSDGVARVTDKTTRQAILNLRQDPQISSQMAAELTNANREALQEKVGGKIGATELYLAHFLGSGGASTFLNKMRTNPSAKAADILPTAASANPKVFYDQEGQPRSLNQIYQRFAKKFDGIDMSPVPYGRTQVQVASSYQGPDGSNLSHLLSGLGLGTSTSSARQSASSDNSYINAMVMAQMSASQNGTSPSPVDMLYSANNNTARRKEGIAAYLGIVA